MKSKPWITTKEHFELFKKHCREWQQRLGLTHYVLRFNHMPDPGTFGANSAAADSGIAIVNLNTDWGEGFNVNNGQLEETAIHEMLHVLLADYASLAFARFTTAAQLQAEEEAIIRRLTHAFKPLLKEGYVADLHVPMSQL